MSTSDPFGPISELPTSFGPKKKPPPRPPPPKSSRVPSATKNISIFGRRKTQKPPATAIVRPLSPAQNIPTGTLIDLSGPPIKFQYDSKISSYKGGSSSSLSSHVESGFEDDFESVFSSRTPSPWTESCVGWSSPDSPPQKEFVTQKEFKIPAPTKAKAPPVPRPAPVSNRTQYSPTIICVQPASSGPKAKPARPPPPGLGSANKFEPKSQLGCSQFGSSGTQFGLSAARPRASAFGESALESSPPMPSIPPPPPPADIMNILHNQPQVPPRPSTNLVHEEEDESSCVAMYDYESDHPDDLKFKAGDVLKHLVQVNDEWMKGELRGRSGLFPANYVQIKTPPAASNVTKVICTFPFLAETWDDLSLKEGDIAHVIKRINDDWFLGTCDGRKGQFPSNFVQDISELEDIK